MYGADVVLYSATKYMNGHSDVVMGLLSTNDDELYKELAFLQYGIGLNNNAVRSNHYANDISRFSHWTRAVAIWLFFGEPRPKNPRRPNGAAPKKRDSSR